MMADWQDHLSELDPADEDHDARQFLVSEPDTDLPEDSTDESSTSLVQPHSSTTPPVELPGNDTAPYEPHERDPSSIVPGDIVYIRRQTGEQLLYKKAVYLGNPGGGRRTTTSTPSSRSSEARSAIHNTPAIRNGGFGALQVEAVTNQPLSIARRHLAASQLRMRDVEPDQLSQSEWVRFLVMAEDERERWISQFQRRRHDNVEGAGSSSHIARDWDTKNDLKVSLSELVRKEDVTEEEMIEAKSIQAYVAIQDSETLSKSRFYLKHATLPSEIKSPFITRMNKLATGDEWLNGYDRAMVQNACSAFLKYETQIMGRNVRVEELVRMFYATAVTAAPGPRKTSKKDGPSSDSARQAGIKRHAALLTDILIGVIDEASEQVFPERDIVSAQLREEYAGMLSRANSVVKDDVSSNHREQLKKAELSPQFLEALKSRLATVIDGEETAVTLPRFGAHLMEQACKSFSFRLQSTYPADRAMPLETVLGEFLACAETEIRHDRAESNKESRSVAAERLVALLLSLLISIDAALELERLHDVQPRIRNQFTTVLMEERSRYLSQASEIEERLFRVSQRSKPEFDIHFFTDKSRREHDKMYGEMMTGGEDELSDPNGPFEPKYCYCLRGSHGVMVACDGPNCRRKWFHLSCTDLKKPLDDYKTWFCIFCQPPVSKTTENTQEVAAVGTIDEDYTAPKLEETQEVGETTNERPARGMVCNSCKFVWRSAQALELRDCPNCGSYSVFAESPPRTTSPEATDDTLRPDATGEEAIGQYFSERTNKFMSLYRRETLAKESKPENPRENFPDPWSHLHTSSSTNSPRLEESPPALPRDPLPEIGSSDNTTGDGSAPLVELTAVSRLKRTIRYIEDTTLNLNGHFQLIPYHGSSSSVDQIKEVYDQLCSVGEALENLLQRQTNEPRWDTEWEVKLQGLDNSLQILCHSITITLQDMHDALETGEIERWKEMIRKMEDEEGVSCSKRFGWYHYHIMILRNLADGPTSSELMSDMLQLEGKLSMLLSVQDPDGSQEGHRERTVSTTAEEPATEPPDIGTSSNTTGDASAPVVGPNLSGMRQLGLTLTQITDAAYRLNRFHSESSGSFTGISETKEVERQLCMARDALFRSLRRRSNVADEIEHTAKLQRLSDRLFTSCSTIETTLQVVVIAIDSDDITMRTTGTVQKGLRWYQDLMVALANLKVALANLMEELGDDNFQSSEATVSGTLRSQDSGSSPVTGDERPSPTQSSPKKSSFPKTPIAQ